MSTKLKVAVREKAGVQLEEQRKKGLIPAVLYGHKVAPSLFWVNYLDFERLYRTAGESTIIDVEVEGKKDVSALIHDVARDPQSNRFIHIDFYQVRMDEEIDADIPLEYIGESEAVKAHGGILIKSLDEISIKCLPKNLPRSIQVDITILRTFEDQIKIKDLVLPQGVAIDEDVETVVALVERPRTEAEMASLNEKVEMDVTKVEGVVKEAPAAESVASTEKKDEKK